MQLILNTVTQISAGSSEQTLVCVDLKCRFGVYNISIIQTSLTLQRLQPQLTTDLNLPIIKQHHD